MKLNEIYLFIGRKGTGKTTRCLELAYASRKKIIVIDDVHHPAYTGFEVIETEQLKRWSGTKCRVMVSDIDETLQVLEQYQSNAFVIVEDSSRYIGSNLSRQVKTFIINHRKFNLDVAFMFHFLGEVSPYMARQYTKMVLFKTGDNTEVKQLKWLNWNKIVAKHQKVMRNKENHHCEIVLVDE